VFPAKVTRRLIAILVIGGAGKIYLPDMSIGNVIIPKYWIE
jgi:hypothetical protein